MSTVEVIHPERRLYDFAGRVCDGMLTEDGGMED